MGILATQLASIYGLKGEAQPTMEGALPNSKTHDPIYATESKYDLDGKALIGLPGYYTNPEKPL